MTTKMFDLKKKTDDDIEYNQEVFNNTDNLEFETEENISELESTMHDVFDGTESEDKAKKLEDSSLENSKIKQEFYYGDDTELGFEKDKPSFSTAARKRKLFRILVVVFFALLIILGLAYIIKVASQKEYLDGVTIYVDGIEQAEYGRVEKGELRTLMEKEGFTSDLYISDPSVESTSEDIYLLRKKTVVITYEHNEWEMEERDVYKYVLSDVLDELKIEADETVLVYLNNNLIAPEDYSKEYVTSEAFVKAIKLEIIEEEVEEVITYRTEIIKDDEIDLGTTEVETKGKNGKRLVNYRIKYVDGLVVEREVIKTEIIEEPIDEIILEGTKVDLTGDTDGDGLTDQEEIDLGTDMYKKDTDGDGYNDYVEVDNGTDPNDPTDPESPGE